MDNQVIENLKRIIAEQGLNWEQASVRCGLDRSYFRTLFGRTGSLPRGNTLQKIASGLKVPVSDLMVGRESGQAPAQMVPLGARAPTPTDFAETRGRLPTDVPVLGTAAGSHLQGAFQISNDPVDWARRPPALIGAVGIYALYVEGESMVPQWPPGELIFVTPNKPPRLGDGVVVQIRAAPHEPIQATLGVYARRTADRFVIRKHNPPAEIEIARGTIVDIHKVLTIAELFGM
ncbi:S24 family peptidase [Rhizobium sp. 814_E9_N1_1]